MRFGKRTLTAMSSGSDEKHDIAPSDDELGSDDFGFDEVDNSDDEVTTLRFPGRPLPGSMFFLCLFVTQEMKRNGHEAFAKVLELENALYERYNSSFLQQGKALTFGQLIERARKQGLPFRYPPACGTPDSIWFYMSQQLENLMEWGLEGNVDCVVLQGDEEESFHELEKLPTLKAFRLFRPLIRSVRAYVGTRPTVPSEVLLHHLLTSHGAEEEVELLEQMSLVAYVDEAIAQGIPIRRSTCRGEKDNVSFHVWFYFPEQMVLFLLDATESAAVLCRTEFTLSQEVGGRQESKLLPLYGHTSEGDYLSNTFKECAIAEFQLGENADELVERVARQTGGDYVDDYHCRILLSLLHKIVHDREWWGFYHKRIGLYDVRDKIQRWAPFLLEDFNDLEGLFRHAKLKGMPIFWSYRIVNVSRLIDPVIDELRPKRYSSDRIYFDTRYYQASQS